MSNRSFRWRRRLFLSLFSPSSLFRTSLMPTSSPVCMCVPVIVMVSLRRENELCGERREEGKRGCGRETKKLLLTKTSGIALRFCFLCLKRSSSLSREGRRACCLRRVHVVCRGLTTRQAHRAGVTEQRRGEEAVARKQREPYFSSSSLSFLAVVAGDASSSVPVPASRTEIDVAKRARADLAAEAIPPVRVCKKGLE